MCDGHTTVFVVSAIPHCSVLTFSLCTIDATVLIADSVRRHYIDTGLSVSLLCTVSSQRRCALIKGDGNYVNEHTGLRLNVP
jgi:hypothetical protein